MQLVDLSHEITAGMVTYPGLPGPEIDDYLAFDASHARYAPGTEFSIARITMVANTGTYLDTPGHRFRDGHDLAGLDLARCAMLPAFVMDGDGEGPVGAEHLADVDVRGMAVLLRTGWDRHWGTDRYGDPAHPHLTRAAAELLVERQAALVGIDSVNIDDTAGGDRHAHSVLLAADIPVVEHLTALDELPATGALFFAVPPAVRGVATFPVRAFAAVP